MNEDKNAVVGIVDKILLTLAGMLVSLFDGLKHAVDHSNPSLFALIATLLPFALPLPVAFMTSHSALTFFHWDPWAANVLGFGLEGLGLLVWVKLVDAYIASLSNAKIENFVGFLAGVAIVYEALLVLINVVLALRDGADAMYALVLFLVCLLPALSAATYGMHRRETINQLERERLAREAQKEKERQERRQDRKEAQALKIQYAKDTEVPKLDGNNFRGRKS
jgi:hypothetical protein